MYDSTHPEAIPLTAAMVAGYVDGAFVWPPAAWARFPTAVHVRIAVFASTNDGQVLDVERGDATPAQAPGWVRMRRAAGVDPSVYCSTALWPAVRAAFHAAGVAEPHYWVAAYPGSGPVIPAGAVAHQFAGSATSGGDWDLSVVANFWPGIDPAGGNVSTPDSPADDTIVAYLAGGNRVRMPDGNDRNVFDVLYDLTGRLMGIQTAVAGITAGEATLLAAIKAAPVTDPTATATALEAAGLPTQIVTALLAVLVKAAPAPLTTTGGTAP